MLFYFLPQFWLSFSNIFLLHITEYSKMNKSINTTEFIVYFYTFYGCTDYLFGVHTLPALYAGTRYNKARYNEGSLYIYVSSSTPITVSAFYRPKGLIELNGMTKSH